MSAGSGKATIMLLREGHIVRDGARIVDASSSVSLVVSSGKILVVDTGSPRACGHLKKALSDVGVDQKSVSFVVNTHLHLDHCGCNDLFTEARFVAHPDERPPVGTLVVAQEAELLPGVRILPTPGHTHGCLTVLVQADKRYALCGDAIPTKENYDKHVPPFINFDPRLALRSMDAILAWAEMVVPGHGAPFTVVRKK